MCLAAEVRINKSNGAYVGTQEELHLMSEFIKHLLENHEESFRLDISNSGFLNIYLSNPLEMHNP